MPLAKKKIKKVKPISPNSAYATLVSRLNAQSVVRTVPKSTSYNKKKFPGKGCVLGGTERSAAEIYGQQDSTELLLKPTPMARCMQSVIDDVGLARNFSNGIGWDKRPRQTRKTQTVSRKTKDSVEATSEAAQNKVVNLFASANDATTHAKRKTLHVEDFALVNSILLKNGFM